MHIYIYIYININIYIYIYVCVYIFIVPCLHIHQAYNMWDIEHKLHLIYRYYKFINSYLLFFKMYLFLWRHLEINSVVLFSKFLWLALAITYFSVKHRSHLLDPHLYVEAQAVILHFTLKLMPLSCSFQMCVESSVFCSWCRWQNEFVWLLSGDLNSPTLAP